MYFCSFYDCDPMAFEEVAKQSKWRKVMNNVE